MVQDHKKLPCHHQKSPVGGPLSPLRMDMHVNKPYEYHHSYTLCLHGHYSGFCPYSQKDNIPTVYMKNEDEHSTIIHSCLHAAVHTPINVMGHHLLEEVGAAVFTHIQKPVDIQVFHNARK